ncbi:hypothetical protein ACLBR5_16985 [Escherichia coli]
MKKITRTSRLIQPDVRYLHHARRGAGQNDPEQDHNRLIAGDLLDPP